MILKIGTGSTLYIAGQSAVGKTTLESSVLVLEKLKTHGPAWNISQRHSCVERDVDKNAYHSIVLVIVKKNI